MPFARGLAYGLGLSAVLWAIVIYAACSCVGCVQPGSVAVKASLIDRDGAQWLQHEIGKVGDRLWTKLQEESNNRAIQVKAASSQPVAVATVAADRAGEALATSKANASALRWQRAESACEWLSTILAGILAFIRVHRKLTPAPTATVSP